MYLRELKLKDAPLMLEWMHNENVTHNLAANFASKTIEDCENFIKYSISNRDDIHLAIASDEDEYMGTCSLKHVDYNEGTTEFAITVRECSMGKGYSWYGMSEIIRLAFAEYKLNAVYWCVSRKNERAVRFYDKHKFNETTQIPKNILDRYEGTDDLKWYVVLKGDSFANANADKQDVLGCPVVKIKTVSTEGKGTLSFFEADKDIPFGIKRIYYISNVPEGERRGYHAHKELKQLLFCPYGKIQLVLDNGYEREEITLSDPSMGVIINQPMWRETLWLEKNSALVVAASDYYKVEDYIRDYKEFLKFINKN